MTKIERILVPVDFGPQTWAVIDLAATFAERFDAQLTLLHVWQPPAYPYLDLVPSTADLSATVERAARARLEQVLAALQQRSPRSESLLRSGVPAYEILELIASLKPDLVVMGTHGRRGLERALLGSVAEKVVRVSSTPVLTTHAGEARA